MTESDLNLGFLKREAEQLAPKAIIKQLRRSPTPTTSPEPGSDGAHSPLLEDSLTGSPQAERNRRLSISSVWSSISGTSTSPSSTIKRSGMKYGKVEVITYCPTVLQGTLISVYV